MGKVIFWGMSDGGGSPNEDLLYQPDPWDSFFINDDQVPGKCWIENKGLAEIEVNVKKGKGGAGSTTTFLGYDPKAFDLVVRIATPAQWDIFQDLRNKYWAGPTKKTKPPTATVKVSHPDLASINIDQAVIIGVPTSEQSDVEGAKNFRIRFHEQVLPKAVKVFSAAGALPAEDPRQPASAALNSPKPAPSTVPANMGLGGPVLTNTGSAQ